MSAADLFRHLQEAGFELAAVEGGALKVAPASRLDEQQRAAIRSNKAELLALVASHIKSEQPALISDGRYQPDTARDLARSNDPVPGNPLMTTQQSSACHAGGWGDAEIERFTARVMSFVRKGVHPEQADCIAERLVLRDRQADDRRVCAECQFGRPGRCSNHRAAGLASPAVPLDFVTRLQRCEGLTQWH